MKRIIRLVLIGLFSFCLMASVQLMASGTARAGDTESKTWGQIKALYGEHESSTPTLPRGAGAPQLSAYRYQIKPFGVNEHWRDPNNPGSGEHVVLFFFCPTGRNPLTAARLWQGYRRDWLDSWMMWDRMYTVNQPVGMLFADGWFWWPHRFYQSAATLASQFELCW